MHVVILTDAAMCLGFDSVDYRVSGIDGKIPL
jgi:hypothetical protein